MSARFALSPLTAALALGLALTVPVAASAQTSAPAPAPSADSAGKPAPKQAPAAPKANADKTKANAEKNRKQAKKAPEPEPEITMATPEQLAAASQVYTGASQCELNQTIDVEPSARHAGYIDVRQGKKSWLMKPVLSSTGALRLEDVRREALMIQIGTKSMLLNQKTGQRFVDDCRHPKQLEVAAPAAAGMLR